MKSKSCSDCVIDANGDPLYEGDTIACIECISESSATDVCIGRTYIIDSICCNDNQALPLIALKGANCGLVSSKHFIKTKSLFYKLSRLVMHCKLMRGFRRSFLELVD